MGDYDRRFSGGHRFVVQTVLVFAAYRMAKATQDISLAGILLMAALAFYGFYASLGADLFSEVPYSRSELPFMRPPTVQRLTLKFAYLKAQWSCSL